MKKFIFLRLSILFYLSICFVFISCKKQNESTDNIEVKETNVKSNIPIHEIVKEEIYDAPVKTQVVQHIFITDKITEENLRKLLDYQFKTISKRTGFDYHDTPTNVYIYLYDTKEKAEAEQGLWIAMSELSYGGVKPTVTIRNDQIDLFNKKPEIKFGLSESERKNVFKKISKLEKQAMDEAIKRFPSDINKQIELENKLVEKYKNQLAKKYKLSKKNLSSISVEGITKQWPF